MPAGGFGPPKAHGAGDLQSPGIDHYPKCSPLNIQGFPQTFPLHFGVDRKGLEPLTPRMQIWCSTKAELTAQIVIAFLLWLSQSVTPEFQSTRLFHE